MSETMEIERLKATVEVWKKTIDVQQHFNDLELRIRNFAVTVLVAVLGATGLSIREGAELDVAGLRTPLAAWFLTVGLIAWVAFYFMDRWWYHRLLYGAVEQGRQLEESLRVYVPTASLTETIGKASPFYLAGWKIRSPRKIDLFYGGVAMILLLVIGALHVAG